MTDGLRIGYICPTYQIDQFFDYTRRSLLSFFKYTADGVAVVVDDGSTGWSVELVNKLSKTVQFAGQEIRFHHFPKNGGLTRSWNLGLQMLKDLSADYAIPANNDILFTPQWYAGLLHALENGYQLVGPLSNAPGVTALGKAEVWQYIPDFELTDRAEVLRAQASYLYTKYLGRIVEANVNGFFQMAKMQTWVDGMYSKTEYYRPKNTHTSKGRNRTPLMTANEDELQGRWTKKGWKMAVVPSSYIFHYRAVTRGSKYKRGRWFRLTDANQEV